MGAHGDNLVGKRAEGAQARQQAAVAELGLMALAYDDLDGLVHEAVEVVAKTLGVGYAKIVEALPGGEELLLRAGVGWGEGLVGRAREDAGLGSQAGFTLLSDGPVVSDDVRSETRFRPPPLLVEHGVVGSMTVVIPGHLWPYGVLGAHAGERRVFTADDVNFLQAVANVLAAAIERERSEEAVGEIRAAERARIARDLHDGPLQDLAYGLAEVHVAGMDLTNDDAASAAAAIGRASSALRRVSEGLRASVNDLRLGGELDRPLPALVEALVERARSMDPGCDIRLEVRDGFPAGPAGGAGSDTGVVRVVWEALTNARRHSGAENVLVGLWLDGDFLVAEVADDGRGFGPGTAPGVGRGSMRERAEALGGTLEVRSVPGEGTRVRLRVPAGDARRGTPPDETGNQGGGETTETGAVRVMLVEDRADFRRLLASVLDREADMEVVAQAGSLEEARARITPDGCDVTVLDMGLPDGVGSDLVAGLRELCPGSAVLILSASLDAANRARAEEAGADGVLDKFGDPAEVVEEIRRLGNDRGAGPPTP